MPLLLFALTLFAKPADARSQLGFSPTVPSCEHLVSSVWTWPFDALVRGRVNDKVSYAEKRFDVRLIVDPSRRPRWSASLMLALAVVNVTHSLNELEKFGFRPTARIHVLVVLEPDLLMDRPPQLDWSKVRIGPHLNARGPRIYGIPSAEGVRSLVGNFEPETLGDHFLILDTFSHMSLPDLHSANSRFTVGHEVGHATDARLTFVWREVRADLLAFLATGQSALSFPRVKHVPVGFEANELIVRESFVHRSLSHPHLKTLEEIIPLRDAEHANSQILSSALYEIAREFDRDVLARLIHFLDASECRHLVDLSVGDRRRTRLAYRAHLLCLGEHTRAFASRHGLKGIGEILRSHGL